MPCGVLKRLWWRKSAALVAKTTRAGLITGFFVPGMLASVAVYRVLLFSIGT